MSFVSYNNKEDMQDETYKSVSIRLLQADEAVVAKDTELAYRLLESVWRFIHMRVKGEEKQGINRLMADMKDRLYEIGREMDKEEESSILDDCHELMMRFNEELDRIGILYRMRTDLDNLVATSK